MLGNINWTSIILALIAALPGIVAAILTVRQNPYIRDIHKETTGPSEPQEQQDTPQDVK